MSTVNGESAMGSVKGCVMATSEDADPLPSVEVPEGADILPRERKELTADNLFDRQYSQYNPASYSTCFCLEPFIVKVRYIGMYSEPYKQHLSYL